MSFDDWTTPPTPMGGFPGGRKVAGSDRPRNWVGSVEDGLTATEDRLKLARSRWSEAQPDAFEHLDGHRWRDRATGREYRRVAGNPLYGDENAVALFVVRDGRLVFLRPDADRAEHRHVGTMRGLRATGKERIS
jgi:hypothetical protein